MLCKLTWYDKNEYKIICHRYTNKNRVLISIRRALTVARAVTGTWRRSRQDPAPTGSLSSKSVWYMEVSEMPLPVTERPRSECGGLCQAMAVGREQCFLRNKC